MIRASHSSSKYNDKRYGSLALAEGYNSMIVLRAAVEKKHRPDWDHVFSRGGKCAREPLLFLVRPGSGRSRAWPKRLLRR